MSKFYIIWGTNKIFYSNTKALNLDYTAVYYDVVYSRHLKVCHICF